MKKAIFIFLVVLFTQSQAMAYGCGFPPFGPLGCTKPPICVCDSNGNCEWIFVC